MQEILRQLVAMGGTLLTTICIAWSKHMKRSYEILNDGLSFL
jgi:hypothetical protein